MNKLIFAVASVTRRRACMMFAGAGFGAASLIAIGPVAHAAPAAHSIDVDTRLSQSLLQAGKRQRIFLQIAIKGRRGETAGERTPANISLVIDRSGSMRGQKMIKAREAAKMAINRLGLGDIASVVVFDHKIDTLVNARKVTDPGAFHGPIDTIAARGNTAIYAAVEEAARQIRRNRSSGRLNRIILISDGIANVGPSQPQHFEDLGQRLGGQGISVSTIGLGKRYNEDLMAMLAASSDGNHAFARTVTDLTKIFNQEFDEVLSVAGQEVEIIIRTKSGVTPLRTLGRKSIINGNEVRIKINQVYGTAEYKLLLELDIEPGASTTPKEIAHVAVRYTPSKGSRRKFETRVTGRFSPSAKDVGASINPKVMEPVLELEARERARRAVSLRDKGDIEAAKKLLKKNAAEIRSGQQKYKIQSKRLERLRTNNARAASSISDRQKWNLSRKQMREDKSNRQGSSVKY